MVANSIESIINFLLKNGFNAYQQEQKPLDFNIQPFNRVIEFEVENKTYFIEWWINQSYLKLENSFSSPHIPFKFITVNRNSPNSKHKLQLCFYDEEQIGDKSSMFYNPMPFGSFKIPFNSKK